MADYISQIKLPNNTTYDLKDANAVKKAGDTMTGNLNRYYASASSEPMITMLSNNQDIILWEAYDGSEAATTTTSNHYKLLYKGTGTDSSNSNYLQLVAHKTSDVVAIQVDEVGNVSLPQMNKGSATKPIYLNNGVITEGTAIGASAYHDDSYFSLSGHTHNYAGSASAGGPATYLGNIGRLTDMNINFGSTTYNSKFFISYADGDTTSNKPYQNAMVLNIAWDNVSSSNKYGAQIAIGNGATPHLQLRGCQNGTWDTSWLTVLDSNNYNTYAAAKSHTHGNITNSGTIGTANAARVVVTNASNEITVEDLTVTDNNASTNATTTFVQAVTQSATGKITITKASLDTSGDWAGNAANVTGTVAVTNGGTGVTTVDDIFATYGIEYIEGTQTGTKATHWTGNTNSTSLYVGKTIAYKLPIAGDGSATLELTFPDGTTTGQKAVYAGNTRLTTHYPANSIMIMVWNGTEWRTNPYYNTNTNTATRQNVRTTDANYSLLFADPVVGTANNNTAYYTYRNDSIYVNPSTGTIYATTFDGDLDGKASSAGNADTVGSKSVSTTAPSSSSTDSVFPTSKAVWSAISNASGYGCTGTVTSITLKAGGGITLDTNNTAITSSGTRTISITNLDTTSGDTTKWLNQKGGWTTPTPSDIGAASDTHSHNYVTSIENLTGDLSLSDLGLSQALRFKGITSSPMSESFTGVPVDIGNSYTPQIGDVVIDSNTDYEYVCIDATTGNSPTYTWESLGGDSSWALSTHTHGNITNGGCITTAITLAKNDYLIVGDTSASGKLGKGPVLVASISSQDKTSKFLRQDGTWSAPSYYTHPTDAGNKHIPSGGSSGQFLKYSGTSGTATWSDLPTASTSAAGIIQIGTDAATKAMPGDTKVDGVKTTAVGSSNNIEYKILGSAGGASLTSESIYEAVYSTGITFNPKTNTITASKFSGTLAGNATSATSANITTTSNSVAYYTNDSGTFGYKASADGALYATEANGTLSWGTLPVLQGGTGVTSFTDDCVIVSTGTPQTLVSRGLKITGGTGDSTVTVTSYKTNSKLVIQPNGSGAMDLSAAAGAMTISTTTGALDIKTNSSSTSKGNITLKATGTKGTVSIESNKESVSISSGTSTSITAGTSISLTSGSSGAITITSGHSLSLSSGSSQDLSITSANDVILTNGSSSIAKLTGTAFQPGTDQSVDLGTSSIKWGKLYVGTAISYGDIYQPVYWNEGVPAAATGIIQEAAFEFTVANNGVVTIGNSTTPLNTSANSKVIQIVVKTGISYLQSEINWSINNNDKIVLTATVAGKVTGYILYIK